jgi:hypothetical protein
MDVQKLKVESTFSKKVQQAGGTTKAQAIGRADAVVTRTKPRYHEWVSEYVLILEDLFAKARNSGDFDQETFDAAYLKTAHIRNLGSTFGHEMVTAVADRLCEPL